MQPGTVINMEFPGHKIGGGVYLAYSKEDAENYKIENGGIVFKEQGQEIYRVFPQSINGYNGIAVSMEG